MHTLIVPCAGLSTRFSGTVPKWALYHPDGWPMVCGAVRGVRGAGRVIVTLRGAHYNSIVEQMLVRECQKHCGVTLEVHVVVTSESQVDTVRKTIAGCDVRGPVTVRDSDSTFDYTVPTLNLNSASVGALAMVGWTHEAKQAHRNKSFVQLEGGRVLRTAEKNPISDVFCVGAYSFGDAQCLFELAEGRQYMSEVAQALIERGGAAYATPVANYADWGTEAEWTAYCTRATT